MKKKILLFLIIGISVVVNAQQYIPTYKPLFERQHDLRFGVGCKPFEAANIRFGEFFDFYDNSYFDTKDYYSGARYTTNSWFVEYTYQANSWFGVGATANYLAYYNNYYDGVTDKCIGNNMREHYSLYPTVRFTWLRLRDFAAYSTLGVGWRLIMEHDVTNEFDNSSRETGIAGQITLLGFTLGNRMYGFTDLLTLGSQGMLNVGIGYRLTVPQKKR